MDMSFHPDLMSTLLIAALSFCVVASILVIVGGGFIAWSVGGILVGVVASLWDG